MADGPWMHYRVWPSPAGRPAACTPPVGQPAALCWINHGCSWRIDLYWVARRLECSSRRSIGLNHQSAINQPVVSIMQQQGPTRHVLVSTSSEHLHPGQCIIGIACKYASPCSLAVAVRNTVLACDRVYVYKCTVDLPTSLSSDPINQLSCGGKTESSGWRVAKVLDKMILLRDHHVVLTTQRLSPSIYSFNWKVSW
jgi:hypothetical protein